MRVTRLMLVTLRDDPAEADIPSHRLLLRAGYTRRISAGVYAYLPLLWRVLTKINGIVRQEMDRIGALETLLPQLQPADLWERSGRWQGYTAGEGIMFHLVDRQDRSMGLGPTHEEVVTALAADLLRSYRQLPVCLYQIQTKFRDEIRPRFGLMRAREFIMKDAYSFHADGASLAATYREMDQAYRRIFQRCGLRAVAVEADSGAIGGSASQEFMVTAEVGEDLILSSADGRYAANQERAVSLESEAIPLEPSRPLGPFSTPAQGSIEALCQGHGLEPSQIVKVLLLLARFAGLPPQPVLVCLRGDQQLNEVKLRNALTSRLAGSGHPLIDLQPLTADQVAAQELAPLPFGFLGPQLSDGVLAAARDWAPRFERLADSSLECLGAFVCGSNQDGSHQLVAGWDAQTPLPELVDLRAAQPGDRCQHDPEQRLVASRGIEVGHIFQLGSKYSEALEARFTTEDGVDEPLVMGCYGIGVSRLAQAAVEQHHDAQGICWPLAIAPFELIVVIANAQDGVQLALAEQLYAALAAAGIEVLLDDRAERAGVKFKDADLIGIPWRVVVGRGAATGMVEVVERAGGVKHELAADALLPWLEPRIEAGRRGLLPDEEPV
ncbi:proline--tRNA ligase [Synechococcus sp. CS-602]|uniref:proline--tRNA ligase n=1 Tax=Synechococcaceae TaxID=1890426 RepID=UPI0008FF0EB1|nr:MULTISPECIES: proline--tRNA ligase [Synechococcaceae]MCT4365762.1 proline--tRNA ligase [Candidatus Regnicoccus frigidus MAG-AL1]APD49089.1 proline--tRNA ligase [Synechococcus sp. SynAce01]MCT0201918.1 proline--tRNA ligase [Synechococcus sp. CS-603]MCT0205526.1 proline--tRNA ligase [Synechococcus sp. CS-602]MCT0246937.1 proline--tRNA ligase [Synechococcus sp. CS-601]